MRRLPVPVSTPATRTGSGAGLSAATAGNANAVSHAITLSTGPDQAPPIVTDTKYGTSAAAISTAMPSSIRWGRVSRGSATTIRTAIAMSSTSRIGYADDPTSAGDRPRSTKYGS